MPLYTVCKLSSCSDKLLGKVSLSPQRRSFQRGCSWKDKVGSGGHGEASGSPTATAASPLSTSHNEHFSFDHKRHHGGSLSGSGNPLPRGINHSSARDKDHSEGRKDARRNWETSGRDTHRNRASRNTVSLVCRDLSDLGSGIVMRIGHLLVAEF